MRGEDQGVAALQAAEARLVEAIDLLDCVVDDDRCELDHNGNCQAHMWFPYDQGRTECYMARIKRFLASNPPAAAQPPTSEASPQ